MEKILSKAITLALKAHEGQVDKSGMPYAGHIMRVKTNPLAAAVKINDLTDNMDVRRYKELSDWDVRRLRKYLKAYQELTSKQK